ncbi:sulfotransferase family protein [Neotamlana laminarinivorans]|uniref:Sulfotransferase n=1 Tax=Neotamlana laminarinivorans TaxID=2883124 RepID=A0A9X1I140_9FLAO|nr:sulfotransferase [Tamlana laminarinivorans]MCB4798322.1 sulfotransferase [Tamlana laminarinivorans]
MKKIIVTGARRTATTFFGQVIAFPDNNAYIFEPLNRELGAKGLSYNVWYPKYNTVSVSKTDKNIFNKLVGLKQLSFKKSIGDAKTDYFIYDASFTERIKNVFSNRSKQTLKFKLSKIFFNRCVYEYYKSKYLRSKRLLVIKDPFLALSTPYFTNNYKAKIVVTLRHPVSYYHSMVKQGWFLKFDLFSNKPSEDVFSIKKQMETDYNNIDRKKQLAVLEYLMVYSELLKYKNNPDYIFIKQEDFLEAPKQTIENLYSKLGLAFNEKTEKFLKSYTTHNTKNENRISNTKRDLNSMKNPWVGKVSKEEIDFVKHFSFELLKEFYPEELW